MSIPIDVVFLRAPAPGEGGVNAAERRTVVSVHPRVRPWKPLPLGDGGAQETLELPAGSVERLGLFPGTQVEVQSCIA